MIEVATGVVRCTNVVVRLPRGHRGGAASTRILVIDDEPEVANLYRQQFRRELKARPFLLAFACAAPEALATAEASGETRLILIFSDVNMPA